MNNERGGIISNLFLIPAGAAVVLGAFLLGYYVGKHQGDTGVSLPPLPEVISENLPKPEEFTFYKTLTEGENRTISIDLKPRSANTDSAPIPVQAADAPKGALPKAPEGKGAQIRTTGKSPGRDHSEVKAEKRAPPEKKAVLDRQAASLKPRYTVQVSSYQEKRTAENDVKKMKQRGFAAFVVSSEVPGMGTRHRVRLGSFTNKAAAEKLRNEVRAKAGGSPVVVPE
jgi:cell division septation protein DedD